MICNLLVTEEVSITNIKVVFVGGVLFWEVCFFVGGGGVCVCVVAFCIFLMGNFLYLFI